MTIVFKYAYKPNVYDENEGLEYLFIASSNPSQGQLNGWYETQLTLANCTAHNSFDIGIVTDPDYPEAEAILTGVYTDITSAVEAWTGDQPFTAKYFDSQDDLDDAATARDYNQQTLCFAVGFSEFDPTDNQYAVYIKYNVYQIPDTNQNQIENLMSTYDLESLDQFAQSGFLSIMSSVTQNLIQQIGTPNNVETSFAIGYLPMATPSYQVDTAFVILAIFIPLVYQQAQFFGNALTGIVSENKEHKVQWLLKLMGYKQSVRVMQQAIYYFWPQLFIIPLWNLIVRFILIPKLGYFLFLTFCAMYSFQNWAMFTILYYGLGRGIAVVVFVVILLIQMLISIFITSSGDIYPKVMLYMSWLPYMQLTNFVYFGLTASNNQDTPRITFSTWTQKVLDLQPRSIYLIAVVESILFALLIVYFWPYKIDKDPENPLKWYYPCTPSYWRSKSKKNQVNLQETDAAVDGNQEISQLQSDYKGKLLEEEAQLMADGAMEEPQIDVENQDDVLRIKNLVKKYPGCKERSVNKLSLSSFKNELLVLLGHNGAGKTTTISCITGLVRPTFGSATAFGIDIFNRFSEISDFMGVCPQDNVLLEKITVQENLRYFAEFKGMREDAYTVEINKMLGKFGMENKRNELAMNLSGGQKRKLQLIIALLGDSRIVLLDEPSSGMDPTSRRDTWEVIKEFKENRIVIMTTHYMDEAEVLGDRVAIMSKGSLVCCGSSLFLKNRYGKGFYLEIEKNDMTQGMDQLEDLLKNTIPGYVIMQQLTDNGNLEYNIPSSSSAVFQQLFEVIDESKSKFNIKSYNVRVASLEEVFIEIGKKEQQAQNKQNDEDDHTDQNQFETQKDDLEQAATLMKEYRNSFIPLVKANLQRRYSGGSIMCSLICIPILILLSMSIPVLSGTLKQESSLNYSMPSSIYESVIPMSVPYNTETINLNSQSTDDFFDSIWSSEQGVYQEYAVSYTPDTVIDESQMNSTIIEFQKSMIQNGVDEYGSYLLYSYDISEVNCYVFGNSSSQASLPVYGASILERIAQYQTSIPHLSLQFNNSPLPKNVVIQQSTISDISSGIGNLSIYSYILLALVISFSYSSYFQSGYYTQLLMSGATERTIFFSNYVIDICFLLYFAAIEYAFLEAFGFYVPGFWVPLLLFIITEPIFIYFVCYWLIHPKSISLFLIMTIVFQLIGIISTSPAAVDNNWVLFNSMGYAFFWLPSFNLQFAMTQIMFAPAKGLYYQNNTDVSVYGFYGCATTIIFLVFDFHAYFILLKRCMRRKFKKPQGATDFQPVPLNYDEQDILDEDVIEETNRVEQLECQDLVKVEKLVKVYFKKDTNPTENNNDRPEDEAVNFEINRVTKTNKQKKQTFQNFAVKGVSFGVARGQTFALLGVNGAGKSSTFNCMMGKETISGGNVMLNGIAMRTALGKPYLLHGTLGYCPQVDCFEGTLTVRQQLTLFARLKHIQESFVHQVVTGQIQRFGLQEFEHKAARTLSGGNKRKLCCAMACIGQPEILFIDEASAGVDPASRRQMWKGIKHDSKNSATVLTTHAMEEVEALATKITIMVKGRMNCYGSLQHLKDTYGSGFEIKFRIDLQQLLQNILQDHAIIESSVEQRQQYSIEQVRGHLQKWQSDLIQKEQIVLIDFVTEFSDHGMFQKTFKKVAVSQEPIILSHFKKDVITHNHVVVIVDKMTRDIALTTLITVDHGNVHLRMQQHNQSMGFMFSYLEKIKEKYLIREYSIQQATLEQIFNSFAKGQAFKRLNRRLTQTSRIEISGADGSDPYKLTSTRLNYSQPEESMLNTFDDGVKLLESVDTKNK